MAAAAPNPGLPAAGPGAHSLHGRRLDLLVGAGLAYLLAIPLLLLPERETRALGFVLAGLSLLINTPHYGATLLRVYERSEDRRRYAFFAIHATAAIALLFAVGLHVPQLGALLVTLYVSWSPWHFAGQNFGLSLTFLRRGGTAVDAQTRRWLWLCFFLSFLVSLIVMHAVGVSLIFAPVGEAPEDSYDVLRLGIPQALALPSATLLGSASLAAAGVALVRLGRGGAGFSLLLPVVLLIASQAAWFVVPALLRAFGHSSLPLPLTAAVTSLAHSAQYLWITSYYAERGTPGFSLRGYYARALLGGACLSALPGLFAAPLLLSDLHWGSGLAMLSFSCVNLHHFVLDGAVWKLRDGRVARVLLRPADAPASASAPGPAPRRRFAPVWYALGALALTAMLTHLVSLGAVNSTSLPQVERATAALAWIRRDNSELLGTLGDLYLAEGRLDPAEAAYRKGLTVHDAPELRNNLAWLLAVERGGAEPAGEAVRLMLPVIEQNPDDPAYLDTAAAAYAAAGERPQAVALARAALDRARRAGDGALIAAIEEHLADFAAGRSARKGVLPRAAEPAAADY